MCIPHSQSEHGRMVGQATNSATMADAKLHVIRITVASSADSRLMEDCWADSFHKKVRVGHYLTPLR